MAGGLVTTETARLFASSFNGTAYTLNTGSYVALTTAAASSTSAGTEVSGGSYSRQGPVAFTISTNNASNSSAVNFAGMPAVTVVGINLWDASSGGNRRWWADLSASRTTAAGDTISFAASSISFSAS